MGVVTAVDIIEGALLMEMAGGLWGGEGIDETKREEKVKLSKSSCRD